jgi:hypothetical protein
MSVKVTKEIKILLEEAFHAGHQLGKAEMHNSDYATSRENEEPEITFEDWYKGRVTKCVSGAEMAVIKEA